MTYPAGARSPMVMPHGASPGESVCSLCGLPVGPSDVTQVIGGRTASFCCRGCLHVYLLLSAATGVLPEEFQQTELFRVCVEAGIIASSARAKSPSPGLSATDIPPLSLSYCVEGMWCPSCAWLLEEVLRRTQGVIDPRVSFISDTLSLTYLPHLVAPSEIVSRARSLGYRLGPIDGRDPGAPERRSLMLRLGVSSILTANIMMISLAVYSGYFRDLPPAIVRYFSYPLLAMASFVLFYGGWPILKRGLGALRFLSASMDTLVSIGALASYAFSLVQALHGGSHLYFETSSMLVSFVLLGRYVEIRARQRVSMGIGDLRRLALGKVRIIEGEREQWVGSEAARPGDRFRVAGNDGVPLDSTVVKGTGLVDQSSLTGEPRPRAVAEGDRVAGGSRVLEGELILRTEKIAQESLVGQIARSVEQALARKDAYEVFADRVGRLFVPAVILLAVASACVGLLRSVPLDRVLLRSLAVILISCPCALGLAIPLAKVAVIDLARKAAILVRDPGALERLAKADTIIFDKTGTLTKGDFSLEKVFCPGLDEKTLFGRLASVEAEASHFLAARIVREANARGIEPAAAEGFEQFPGLGVRGFVQGKDVHIGSRAFMKGRSMAWASGLRDGADSLGKDGKTIVYFGWDERVLGFLAFGDALRPGAGLLVDRLASRRIAMWLVSGDGLATTRAVAESLGIANVKAQVTPAGKADFIRSLRDQGHSVVMVGDGLNDAGALAEADVGCAFGGMDLVRESAALTFLACEPAKVIDAIGFSALALRTIRQNLFFAFLYNALAIPIAALGLLNPLIAIAAMFASSLTVTGNTLRMFRTGSRALQEREVAG